MRFWLFKKRLKAEHLFLLLTLYKITIDWVFLGIITKIYDYYGFTGSFSLFRLFISWIVFVLFSCFLLHTVNRAFARMSSLVVFVLYLISFIPFCSLISYGVDPAFLLCNCFFWGVLLFAEKYFLGKNGDCLKYSKIGERRVLTTRWKKAIFILLTIMACCVIGFISWKYTGFRFTISLQNVYSLRLDAMDNSLGFLSYFFGWSNAIVLVALSLAVLNRRYVIALFLVFIQILNFSYNGMKTTFFLTLVVVLFSLFFRKMKLVAVPKILVVIFIVINVFSLLEYYSLGSWQLVNLFSFRTFLLPVKISEWFFDFFKTHEPDFFRTGFMGRLGFESPYNEYGLDYLISGIYFGNYHSRANNGLISDAVANLGFMGVLIMPIAMAAFFHVCDKCSYRVPSPVVLSVVMFFSIYLSNVFFTTFLVTDSGILLCLLMFLIPRKAYGSDIFFRRCS